MPVPFGVSVGDFIAGIELVHTIIQALEESHGAGAHYRSVVSSMKNLESALNHVKNIDSDDVGKLALMNVATQCGGIIERFFGKVEKYQHSLTLGGSKNRCLDALRKVQWALYTKKDVAEFHVEIQAHTISILMMLTCVQGNASSSTSREILRKIDEMISLQLKILESISQCALEIRRVFQAVLIGNFSMFKCFTALQTLFSTPPQILWEHPVTFEDAHGCTYPIHTQSISSWDAFESVLRDKFRSKPGLRMIEFGKYSLTDVATKKDGDRYRPYESIFRPGRKVIMSMVFEIEETSHTHCPSCGDAGTYLLGKSVTCPCGLSYSLKKTNHPLPPETIVSPERSQWEPDGTTELEHVDIGPIFGPEPVEYIVPAQETHDSPGDFVRVVLDLILQSQQGNPSVNGHAHDRLCTVEPRNEQGIGQVADTYCADASCAVALTISISRLAAQLAGIAGEFARLFEDDVAKEFLDAVSKFGRQAGLMCDQMLDFELPPDSIDTNLSTALRLCNALPQNVTLLINDLEREIEKTRKTRPSRIKRKLDEYVTILWSINANMTMYLSICASSRHLRQRVKHSSAIDHLCQPFKELPVADQPHRQPPMEFKDTPTTTHTVSLLGWRLTLKQYPRVWHISLMNQALVE